MKHSVGILIVSDRVAAGQKEDQCLPAFHSALDAEQFDIVESLVVSDDPAELKKSLGRLISMRLDLIFIAGGTGCSPRDNTPEITRLFLDKPTPGLDEAVRLFSRQKSRYALFSRAVSGVSGKTFIINLPGSPKAVAEILGFLTPVLDHPLELIAGTVADCAPETSEDDQLR